MAQARAPPSVATLLVGPAVAPGPCASTPWPLASEIDRLQKKKGLAAPFVNVDLRQWLPTGASGTGRPQADDASQGGASGGARPRLLNCTEWHLAFDQCPTTAPASRATRSSLRRAGTHWQPPRPSSSTSPRHWPANRSASWHSRARHRAPPPTGTPPVSQVAAHAQLKGRKSHLGAWE